MRRPSNLAEHPVRIAAGRRLAGLALVALLAALLAAWPAAAASVALAPLSDRQGDPATAAVVEAAVAATLAAEGHRLVAPERLRDALRERRIRVVDDAAPEELAEVAAAVGADWLLTVTLHQSATFQTPRLALSGRAYDGGDGELLWSGFAAASGLDHRSLLGLGVVTGLDELGRRTGTALAEDLLATLDGGARRPAQRSAAPLGRIAVLPFGSVTSAAGTNAAETATEAVRSLLFHRGAELVSPSRVAAVLRQRRGVAWGGVDTATREALAAATGARWIVTGVVEAYEVGGGGGGEPEPHVALSLRLLATEDGRIAWIGGREKEGWDGAGPFRLGRVYSRGELARRLLDSMLRRLLDETAVQYSPQRKQP